MKRIVVTIDGPAGAGKTTVSKTLAKRLGYTYIDTGALYRGVAFEAIEKGVNFEDDEALDRLCKGLHLAFEQGASGLHLYANGVDISDRIRTPEMSMAASAVSARPIVRQHLLDIQREMGKEKGVVLEGRDMGTVVFPDAEVKFFLDASRKTRALRRYRELAPDTQSLNKVENDMKKRDKDDSSRKIAPLKPADDAITIDSTDIPVDEVVNLMHMHIKRQIA